MPDAASVVLLVRHGLTPTTGVKLPGRAPGLHLSDEGRRQADAAAARIGQMVKRALRIDRDLADLDIGEWTGMSLKQAARRPEWETVQRSPSTFRFPGGESFPEMQTRMTSVLGRIVARHPGQIVVAVSHADPIKAAVAQALGTPLDLFQRIMIAPASITVVAYRRGGPSVITVNSLSGDLAWLGAGKA